MHLGVSHHEHGSLFCLQQGTKSSGMRGCDGRVHHPRPAERRRGLRGGARHGKEGGPGATTAFLL